MIEPSLVRPYASRNRKMSKNNSTPIRPISFYFFHSHKKEHDIKLKACSRSIDIAGTVCRNPVSPRPPHPHLHKPLFIYHYSCCPNP